MYRDDPLDIWLLRGEASLDPELIAGQRLALRACLDHLEAYVDGPPKRPDVTDLTPLFWRGLGGFDPDDLPRAQSLYPRVVEAGGTGTTYVQEALLDMIAAAEDPSSIPFWLGLLDIQRPRDKFAKQRRVMALTALALLTVRQKEPTARDALRQAARHNNADVRAQAIETLALAYALAGSPMPPEMLDELAQIATDDPAFGPRYQARVVLGDVERPVPLDNPGGVYAFKVKFKWDKRIYRTIELRSEQTLDDLHFAIQRAIDWDADHLYSFFMGGMAQDDQYRVSCPFEDDSPPWTDEAVVGELGLTKRHKFLYYFDYGDSHHFEVEVVDIRPQAEPGEYPRVVHAKGDAPAQYGWYEEEGEW